MTDEPTSNNVVRFTGFTRNDLDPELILTNAQGILKDVVVIGTTLEGTQYFATSKSDAKDIMWQLETAKFMLMEAVFYPEDDE